MSDAQLARLVVSLEAKLDKYESQLDKTLARTQGFGGQIKKHFDGVDDRWGKMFGKTEPGKALENVFSRARFNLIDEGGKRLSIFGSAIEDLGVAGIAAAAGVAALALTMERTEKAVEYAANIGKLGKEVGVTTDFIQQFNFAAHQSEIDVVAADEALKKLNISFGAVKSNLARSLQVKAFAAVGLTPEDLRQFKTVDELLPVLADKIKAIGDAAEQAAVAKRLGISDLLPMLKDGGAAFDELTQKARDLGVVMDHATIVKAEEAKKKLSELDDVMKARANVTFAQFADTLITIKQAFLDAETAALRFLAAITGTEPASEKLKKLVAQRASFAADEAKSHYKDPVTEAALDREIAALRKQIADAGGPPASPKGGGALVPGTVKKGPHDDTEAKATAVTEAIASANKQLLEAEKALTQSVEERAAIERKVVAEELTAAVARLDKQKQDIADDKGIKDPAKKRELRAQVDIAEATVKQAAEKKQQLIDQQEIRDNEDQWMTLQQQIGADLDAQARIAASHAATAAKRLAIELELLDAQQREQRSREKLALDRDVASGRTPQKEADSLLAANDARRAAERGDLIYQSAGPLQQYAQSVQDLTTLFQGDAVTAIQSFSSGLADALVNARSFGDVVKNVFRQLLASALTQTLEKSLVGPLGGLFGHIPGFAGGTDFAPGGMARVGEHGMETIFLPRGSQVVPDTGYASGARMGGVVHIHNYSLDGAVLTNEIWDRIAQAQARATQDASAIAQRQTFLALASRQGNRLGRP